MDFSRCPLLRHALLITAGLLALTPLRAAALERQEDRRGDRHDPSREAQDPRAGRSDDPAALRDDPCLEFDEEAPASIEALSRLRISSGGQPRQINEVRFTGLRSLDEARLWRIIGRRPRGPFRTDQAAVVVARVAESGLFRYVEPRLHVDQDGSALLELVVEELPRVEAVRVRGLTEVRESDILAALLRTPLTAAPAGRDDADADDDGSGARGESLLREDAGPFRCPAPVPPREFLAHATSGKVRPGIVWQGIPAALSRVMEALYEDGYLMASLQAELSADGVLALTIDEGRLESVEIHGVPEDVEREVRAELGLEPGRVFSVADVDSAVRRVERRFPFLEKGDSDGRSTQRRWRVVESEGAEGEQVYRLDEGRVSGEVRPRSRKVTITVEDDQDRRKKSHVQLPFDLPDDWSDDSADYVAIEGRKAKVYFDEHRTDLDTDWLELVRHTPVTGFAPGLGLSGWLYDPRNRAHLGVDASLSLNTGRPENPVDYVVGPKVQVPALSIAELGGQIYALTETQDRWRVSRVDSYLHSMILNQPYADYFRRTGVSAFLTGHFARQFTVGAEYRNDVYASMDTVTGAAWFGRIAPHLNPEVDPGRMGSLIGRVEWSTRRVGLDKVGGRQRAPERSIVDRDWYEDLEPGFQTVNTVEVADPRLGGTFTFVRLVSDNGLHIRTGDDQGLRLRLRAAGGRGLPRQKLEALGGWNALRGYNFKEFQGDQSALVMAEYHFGFVSAFADAGSVRGMDGWITPRVGLGAAVNFGPHVQIAAAWRTDDAARLLPEFKAVLNRTF